MRRSDDGAGDGGANQLQGDDGVDVERVVVVVVAAGDDDDGVVPVGEHQSIGSLFFVVVA